MQVLPRARVEVARIKRAQRRAKAGQVRHAVSGRCRERSSGERRSRDQASGEEHLTAMISYRRRL